MEVTVHRLRVLRTVVETGSFNAAALFFGVSQSSISVHIQALEQEVGIPLFIRRPGTAPRLTEAGTILHRFAVEITSKAEQVEIQLNKLRQISHNLTVSVQRTIANDILPPYITKFCSEYPHTDLIIYSQTQNQVIEHVREEKVDIGLIMALDPVPGLHSETIAHQDLVFVVGPNHELAHKKIIKPSELGNYGFIGAIKSSNHAKIIDFVFRQLNINNYNVILQLEDDKTTKEVVMQGIGVAILPLCCVKKELETGLLAVVPVDCRPITLEVRLIYNSKQKISETAKLFINYLKKNIVKHDKLAVQ